VRYCPVFVAKEQHERRNPYRNNGRVAGIHQGKALMTRKMFVNIDVLRMVNEQWSFVIEPEENPKKIFEEIQNNPDLIWTKYDSNLEDADDVDERVESVVDYVVET
jgi:hypothetical protein